MSHTLTHTEHTCVMEANRKMTPKAMDSGEVHELLTNKNANIHKTGVMTMRAS